VEGLAAKLLAELPGQVVQYFHEMRHTPPPAVAVPPPAVGVPPGVAAQTGPNMQDGFVPSPSAVVTSNDALGGADPKYPAI
jgi:hypothetical protein